MKIAQFRYYQIISMLILFLILSVQAIALYYFSSKIIISKKTDTYIRYLDQLNNNIDALFHEEMGYIINALFNYVNSCDYLEKFEQRKYVDYDFVRYSRMIKNDLYCIKNNINDFFDVFLLSEGFSFFTSFFTSNVLNTNKSLESFEFYKKIASSSTGFIILSSDTYKNEFVDFIIASNTDKKETSALKKYLFNPLIVATIIKNTNTGREYVAIILINKDIFICNSNYHNPFLNMSMLLENDNLIFNKTTLSDEEVIDIFKTSTKDNAIHSNLIINNVKRNKYRFISAFSDNSIFKLFYLIPDRTLKKDSRIIGLGVLIIMLVLLTFILFWLLHFSDFFIGRSLTTLIDTIKNNFKGRLESKFKVKKNILNNISLKHLFMFVYGFLFLITSVILTGYCYIRTKSFLEVDRYNLYNVIAEDTIKRVDSTLNYYINLARYISYSKNTQDYLHSVTKSKPEFNKSIDTLPEDIIKDGYFDISGISNINIYDKEGIIKYSLYPLKNKMNETITNIYPNWDKYNFYSNIYFVNIGRNSPYKDTVVMLIEIRKIETFNILGYFAIEFNESKLNDTYGKISQIDYSVVIIDESNLIVSCNNKAFIGTSLKKYIPDVIGVKDKNMVYSIYKKSNINKWKIVLTVSEISIQNQIKSNLIFNLYIFFIVVIIIYCIIYFVYIKLIKPIIYLNRHILSEQKDFKYLNIEKKRITGFNEIHELGENYNILINRIKNLIHKVYTTEIKNANIENEKKEAELNALQSQINPHFIYNTLESINWMIMLNRSEDSLKMLNNFSNLLRISMKRNNLLITMDEEIKNLDYYIDIQKIRFKDKISYKVDITPEVLRNVTIKHILQPIIENSINHGVGNNEKMEIVLRGYFEDGKVVVNVSDNGIGMSKEKLELLNNKLHSSKIKGIGLKNVNDRLKLYFGDSYFIKVTSIQGEGTTVVINLPKSREINVQSNAR